MIVSNRPSRKGIAALLNPDFWIGTNKHRNAVNYANVGALTVGVSSRKNNKKKKKVRSKSLGIGRAKTTKTGGKY